MLKKPNEPRRDVHMHARLEAALSLHAQSRAVLAKPLRRRLDEIAFYPAHEKRLETPAYKAAHRRLVKVLDLPCLVCGVKNSTLKVPKENPYGASALETHHHVIEWALANAIDPDKFNKIMLPHLRAQRPESALYKKRALSKREIAAWVDHSEDNLQVLCDVHHRSDYFGIHTISYPIWGPQYLLRDDFEAYVRTELKAASASDGGVQAR